MPGVLAPPAVWKADNQLHRVFTDLENGDKSRRPERSSVVHYLLTSFCVVFVAAAGLIVYYLLASNAVAAGPISLLAHSPSSLGTSPKGDDRKYQHTTLANGLQVVNVHDKRAVQTAFAVAVDAGSFDDPKSLPGLAHFCEHMLFLGTEKYPDASGFDNFMSANGGSNNAYTADEATVYFGEMSQAAGKEGMDRFADFFRAPLFDKKYVSKEVHAIGSEHAKNEQDPQRRILQVAYSLANPDSPVGAFHTGDVDTLYNIPKKKGIDPVDELKVYFKAHYCPSKMRLVTFGAEPLSAQLAEAKKGFDSLAEGSTCKKVRRSFAKPEPWGAKRMGQFVKVRGTLPQAEVWLHFTLPDLVKEYRSQPLNYLDHVLGYSGEDSLVRVLQDNLGLVTSLNSMFDMSSAGTNLFVILHLTKPGQDNLELVLDVFYAYIAKLRKKGVDMKLYDSIARISKLKWDWAEPSSPSDTASTLAERMLKLPPDQLLSGDSLIEKPNSSLVYDLLKKLTPGNMNLIYVDAASGKGNSSSSDSSALLDIPEADLKTLPHYGVKYSTQTLGHELPDATKRWDSWISGVTTPDVSSRLPNKLVTSGTALPTLPGAIEGVPKEIPLEHMHAAKVTGSFDTELYGTRPKKVSHASSEDGHLLQGSVKPHKSNLLTEHGEVWYRSGWTTTSPKVQLQLVLRPARLPGSEAELPVHEAIRLGVFGQLLAEVMAPKMVDLTATGVGYSIDVASKGLTFTFSGFAPMMPTLISKVLKEFSSFKGNANATNPSRFKRVTEEIREGLKTYSDMPVTYAVQDRNMLLTRGAYSRLETLEALGDVTRKSASSSVDDVLLSKPMRLTSLAMGNVAEEDANKAISTFVGGLQTPKRVGTDSQKTSGEPDRINPVVRVVRPVEIRAKNPRAGDPNDAVVLSIVSGVSTVKSRVILGLLGQILNAVAYNELRTARQLGYVVNAGTSQVSNVQYLSCVVQGNALKADDVEGAIEHVMTHLMPKRLAKLTKKEFAAYKHSFRQELLQPPLKFQDEVNHFWGPVAQGGQCFNLQSNMVRYLDESLHSKDMLVKAWAGLANPTEGMRSKIAVKYFAGSVPPRPTLANATATWTKQGVPDSALALLRREYHKTNVFDHVDSKVREQLVKEGGYFPRDLNCDLAPSASSAPAQFLQMVSQHNSVPE